MRWTKLIELRSWKVWHLAQLSSSEWVWIVQHVLSIWTGDRLRHKHQSSQETNYTNKLKVCLFLLLIWFSWLVQCALISTSDPTTFGLGLSFHSSHLDYFHLCRRSKFKRTESISLFFSCFQKLVNHTKYSLHVGTKISCTCGQKIERRKWQVASLFRSINKVNLFSSQDGSVHCTVYNNSTFLF